MTGFRSQIGMIGSERLIYDSQWQLFTLQNSDMERQVTVEEVRSFLSASDRQFVKGGIRVSRVRFKRDEEGNCTDILLDYEQTVSETGENNAQEGSK